jgi:hypothetical protein
MPCRHRQPGQDQRQGIGARHAVAAPERQAKDRHQREHGDALIPAKRTGHLTQHLADEERAKRRRQRDQESGGQGKVVARQGFRVSFFPVDWRGHRTAPRRIPIQRGTDAV